MKEQALKTLLSAIDFGKNLDSLDELMEAIEVIENTFVTLEGLESIDKMLAKNKGEEFKALSRILELSDKQIDENARVYSEIYGEMYELDGSFWRYHDDVIVVQDAVYEGVVTRVMTEEDRDKVEQDFGKLQERKTKIKERKPSIQELEDFFLGR